MSDLKTALQELVEREQWGLRELARRLHVAPGTAEGWLKGWRMPRKEHYERIAEVLGIAKIDVYLLTGEIERGDLQLVSPGIFDAIPRSIKPHRIEHAVAA